MYFGFALAAVVRLMSEGDPGCTFFTLNSYQATFIREWKIKNMKNGRTDRREI